MIVVNLAKVHGRREQTVADAKALRAHDAIGVKHGQRLVAQCDSVLAGKFYSLPFPQHLIHLRRITPRHVVDEVLEHVLIDLETKFRW